MSNEKIAELWFNQMEDQTIKAMVDTLLRNNTKRIVKVIRESLGTGNMFENSEKRVVGVICALNILEK